MAISISEGRIKKRNVHGKWQWQMIATITENGKARQVTKLTGCACDPPTEAELGRGRRVDPKGKGSGEARRLLKTWRAELLTHAESAELAQKKRSQTVPEFCDAYWATKTNVADNTKKEYRKARKHIDHPALHMDIGDLEADDVQIWLDKKRSEACGDTAIKKAFVQLKAACAWGCAWDTSRRTPVTPSKYQRRSRDRRTRSTSKPLRA